jgi:hypothetical protein
LYETPAPVVLAVEELPQPPARTWEHFAHRGGIVGELRAAGQTSSRPISSIMESPDQHDRRDFLLKVDD